MSLVRFSSDASRKDFINATKRVFKLSTSPGNFTWLSSETFNKTPYPLLLKDHLMHLDKNLERPHHVYVLDFERVLHEPSHGLSNTYEIFHNPNRNLFFYYLYDTMNKDAFFDTLTLKKLPWVHNNYSTSTRDSLLDE